MIADVLLGLDLGTTNCKALAIAPDGELLARSSVPTPVCVGPLSEQELDANNVWRLCASLIRDILERLDSSAHIVSIAVSSIGESGVLLDRTGAPMAPVLLWHDKRTMPYVEWWKERLSEEEIFRITGLTLRHIFSANKLLWYRDHVPDILDQSSLFLNLADWITFRLCGNPATTPSLACRTLLYNLRSQEWSTDLLQLTAIPRRLLPPIKESGEIVGTITKEAAEQTGLCTGTPVVTGGHDHACAAFGAGVVRSGLALDSAGTVEAILEPTDLSSQDEKVSRGLALGCQVVPSRHYLLGSIMSGAVVEWLVRILNGPSSLPKIAELLDEAMCSPLGSNGVTFQPYLAGSGPPENNDYSFGAWLGLHLDHTRADILRAAVEGLTFGIRHLAEAIGSINELEAREFRTVGGGSQFSGWGQMKADVLGLPVQTLVIHDVAAHGAASLSGVGVKVFADYAEAVNRTVRLGPRYEPREDCSLRYDALYHSVFEKTRDIMKRIPL